MYILHICLYILDADSYALIFSNGHSLSKEYVHTHVIFSMQACVCLCKHHITFQVGLLIKDGSN